MKYLIREQWDLIDRIKRLKAHNRHFAKWEADVPCQSPLIVVS